MSGSRHGRVTAVRQPPKQCVDLTLSDSDDDFPRARGQERYVRQPSGEVEAISLHNDGFNSEDEQLAVAMSLQQPPRQALPKSHSVISIGDSSDDDDARGGCAGGNEPQLASAGAALGKRVLSSERVDAEERSLLMAMQRSEYDEALLEDQRKEKEVREEAESSARAEAEEAKRERRRRLLAEGLLSLEAEESDAEAISLSIRLPGKARAQAERRFGENATWADAKAWAASEVAKDASLPLDQMWWPEDFELALSYPLTVLSTAPARLLSADRATLGKRARLQLHRG